MVCMDFSINVQAQILYIYILYIVYIKDLKVWKVKRYRDLYTGTFEKRFLNQHILVYLKIITFLHVHTIWKEHKYMYGNSA